MKVFAVLLLAVCAASAATVEVVHKDKTGENYSYTVEKAVPPAYALPTPYQVRYVSPYVAPVVTKEVEGKPVVTAYTAGAYPVPYVAPYVAPVVAKTEEGKPVVTTYTAGAYPVPVGAYPYSYGYPYAQYPYAPYVVAKPEKVE